MFVDFFLSLKKAKVPVTLREYLMLLEGMEKGVADYNVNEFYFLSRACLVKDERNLDKFDFYARMEPLIGGGVSG